MVPDPETFLMQTFFTTSHSELHSKVDATQRLGGRKIHNASYHEMAIFKCTAYVRVSASQNEAECSSSYSSAVQVTPWQLVNNPSVMFKKACVSFNYLSMVEHVYKTRSEITVWTVLSYFTKIADCRFIVQYFIENNLTCYMPG